MRIKRVLAGVQEHPYSLPFHSGVLVIKKRRKKERKKEPRRTSNGLNKMKTKEPSRKCNQKEAAQEQHRIHTNKSNSWNGIIIRISAEKMVSCAHQRFLHCGSIGTRCLLYTSIAWQPHDQDASPHHSERILHDAHSC
jgi:hypothetical protein